MRAKPKPLPDFGRYLGQLLVMWEIVIYLQFKRSTRVCECSKHITERILWLLSDFNKKMLWWSNESASEQSPVLFYIIAKTSEMLGRLRSRHCSDFTFPFFQHRLAKSCILMDDSEMLLQANLRVSNVLLPPGRRHIGCDIWQRLPSLFLSFSSPPAFGFSLALDPLASWTVYRRLSAC